jgi:hypothetical protein
VSNPSSRPSSPTLLPASPAMTFKKVRIRGTLGKSGQQSPEPEPSARRRRKAVPEVSARPAASDPLRRSAASDGTRPRYATLDALAEARSNGKAPLPQRPSLGQQLLGRPSAAAAGAGVVSGSRSFASPRPWKTPRRPNPDPHSQDDTPRLDPAAGGLEPEPEPEPQPQPQPYSQRHMLSAEELVLVDALRVQVSDVLEDEAFARLRDDTTLHRFVCARQGDLEAAEAMMRSRLSFHRAFGLDDVWAGWRPAKGRSMSPRAEIGSKIFYGGLSGWTKEGGPLLVERLGQADLAGISREGALVEDLALEAYVVYLETVLRMDIRATREEQR